MKKRNWTSIDADFEKVIIDMEGNIKADSVRIMACVRACKDIADPSVIPEMVTFLKDMLDHKDIMESDIWCYLKGAGIIKLENIIAKAEGRE